MNYMVCVPLLPIYIDELLVELDFKVLLAIIAFTIIVFSWLNIGSDKSICRVVLLFEAFNDDIDILREGLLAIPSWLDLAR